MAVDKTRFIPESQIKVESSGNIGSSAISAEGTNKVLSLDKMGNTVQVSLTINLSSSIAGNNALIATIPEKYRPRASREITSFGTYGGNYTACTSKVNSDGTIKTTTGSNTFTGNYRISSSYFI